MATSSSKKILDIPEDPRVISNTNIKGNKVKYISVDLRDVTTWEKLQQALSSCGVLSGELKFEVQYTTSDLRDAADRYEELAEDAHEKNRHKVGVDLHEKAENLRKGAIILDKRLAFTLFAKIEEEYVNELTLDLHDQTRPNADSILKIHMWLACKIGSIRRLKVITGWGSSTGLHKIKTEVENILKKLHIRFDYDVNELNAVNYGALIVNLDDACDIRDAADRYEELAKDAHEKNRHEVGVDLHEKAENLRKGAIILDKRLAFTLFAKIEEEYVNELTLDLHDQTRPNADSILKIHMWLACKIGSIRRLKVITGWGSSTGLHKIKTEVENILKKLHIRFDYDVNELNAVNYGALIVNLDDARSRNFSVCS